VSLPILRDSTSASDIPLEVLAAVGGYGDGEFVWSAADWARFPASIVPLSIVTNAANQGDVLDVERGDATPAEVPGWVLHFDRPARRRPTIYSSRWTWPAVRQALHDAGLEAVLIDWWAATLDGTTDVPGAVAVQAFGSAMTGGHYDESVILDPSWIGILPSPPQPSPALPTHQEEPSMPITVARPDGSGRDVFAIAAGQLHHVAIGADGAAHFNDHLEGSWAALVDAWWEGSTLSVRGLGTDGVLWLACWTDGTWSPNAGAIKVSG
jgi:hypothetical protein